MHAEGRPFARPIVAPQAIAQVATSPQLAPSATPVPAGAQVMLSNTVLLASVSSTLDRSSSPSHGATVKSRVPAQASS